MEQNVVETLQIQLVNCNNLYCQILYLVSHLLLYDYVNTLRIYLEF